MFDLSNVEVNDSFEVLPKGWYPGHVESCEWKASSAGPEYLNLKIKLDNGRYVFHMLHVFNANEMARNIAMQTVKKMVTAMGGNEKMTIASKEELATFILTVNCDFYLGVKVDSEYGDKNEVKNIRKREETGKGVSVPKGLPF